MLVGGKNASLRKADRSPLDHNPLDCFSMDRHRTERSGATTYWVRGGELLNVWIARYEPDSAAFEQEEGDWLPVSREEILREVGEAFTGSASRDDLLALAGAIFRPTKWGLYDRPEKMAVTAVPGREPPSRPEAVLPPFAMW